MPASLSRLSGLYVLELSQNVLSGSVADDVDAFANWIFAEQPYQHSNRLAGSLPRFIASMASLSPCSCSAISSAVGSADSLVLSTDHSTAWT